MSTWTCKGPLAALGLLAVAGCGAGGLPFGATPDQATRAELARGAVTIAAPPGYCIDRRALRRAPRGDFALLARCDTLGIRGFFPGRRLALITVTTAPQDPDAPAPGLAELKRSVAPAEVIETDMAGEIPLVRLDTPGGSVQGVAPQHWRGAFVLNGQLVALALYAPETESGPPAAGAELLADLAGRTRRASAPDPAPDTAEAETAPGDAAGTGDAPASPLKWIGGLFD